MKVRVRSAVLLTVALSLLSVPAAAHAEDDGPAGVISATDAEQVLLSNFAAELGNLETVGEVEAEGSETALPDDSGVVVSATDSETGERRAGS